MENILCKNAGKRIYSLRIAGGYSREELARKAGISGKFLFEIEQGRKKFSAETLGYLAMALGVSCDYIMFGKLDNGVDEDGIVETILLFDKKQQQKLIPILVLLHEFASIRGRKKRKK